MPVKVKLFAERFTVEETFRCESVQKAKQILARMGKARRYEIIEYRKEAPPVHIKGRTKCNPNASAGTIVRGKVIGGKMQGSGQGKQKNDTRYVGGYEFHHKGIHIVDAMSAEKLQLTPKAEDRLLIGTEWKRGFDGVMETLRIKALIPETELFKGLKPFERLPALVLPTFSKQGLKTKSEFPNPGAKHLRPGLDVWKQEQERKSQLSIHRDTLTKPEDKLDLHQGKINFLLDMDD